jgi:hypothetical protein
MKRSLLWTFVAVAWVGAAGAQQASPQPKASAIPVGPRITIEPLSFDFGPALQDKTLTKEFLIKNFGSSDLVIESVSTTCGCTVGHLDTRTLKPGMSVPLRVSLETRNYPGALQRAVLVRSNDPTKALFEVRVQAQVQPAAAGEKAKP